MNQMNQIEFNFEAAIGIFLLIIFIGWLIKTM